MSIDRSVDGVDVRAPKLVLAMVGLPARGKSHIAKKLARFLSWLGHPTRIFNVGSYRRSILGAGQSADFFDPTNEEAQRARAKVSTEAIEDMCAWLDRAHTAGAVAIYDATNTTRAQRARITAHVGRAGHELVFVESICDDESVIEENVRKTKLSNPDYTGVDPEAAAADFRARIAHYARAYQPLDPHAEPDARFIQIHDLGREVRLHRIDGWLPSRVVSFLLNIHVEPRTLWLTRHGESASNIAERIGGDLGITSRGHEYARRLARFVDERIVPRDGRPLVWSSTLQRARNTAAAIAAGSITNRVAWRALDEIDAGICDGMTYDEIARAMPDEYAARRADKLRYRYPRGESYQDVIERLSPIVVELERTRGPLLVVSHQAVLRIVYGYFMDHAPEVCPRLDIPLHTIIELDVDPSGCRERRHFLGPARDRPYA